MDPFHHVRDGSTWELPRFVLDLLGRTSHIVLPLGLTKYMVLQVVAALLVFVIFRGLVVRTAGGRPVKGVWWNFWELLALYVRDDIVRPSIGYPHHAEHHEDGHAQHEVNHTHISQEGGHDGGHGDHALVAHQSVAHLPVEVGHPADKYLPYVWSVFFYVLFCNLLGAIPFLGSPTADINVTGVLALVTFAHVVYFGSNLSGFGDFLKSLVPHMDLPKPMAIILLPMIWVIEAAGLLIKHGVLGIRLFANMMAGHTVLGVFLGFIAIDGWMWFIVMPASVVGQVALGLLELFFAFLQAYVFALLTSLFISAAVNPH